MPDVLDVPGVVAAQRYDIAEVKVPDDEDLLSAQIAVEQLSAAFFGDGGDLIAVLVVITKRARLKHLP